MPDVSRQPFIVRQFRRKKCTCIAVGVMGLGLCLVLLSFLAFGANGNGDPSLRLVSVLFRHGDRNPTETYRNDPYNDPSVWPEGWGELTKVGKFQMYKYGQRLRARYDGFLSPLYSPDEIYVASSDNDRCIMSAETLLAGMYPPPEAQKWHPDLDWQPIPVHTTPRSLDQLITVKKPCPRYDQDLKAAYNSPGITEINEENRDLYTYLTQHTGQDVDNITAVEFLFNTLEIEDMRHLVLPDWTKSVYPHKMKMLAARSLAIFTETDSMKRSRGGPLIKDMVRNMISKADVSLKPDRKMFFYSAHDITIVNVWRALGFSEPIKPGYGASLVLELHMVNGGADHEVKILYSSDTIVDPQVLAIPGCRQPCSLNTFKKIMGPVMPDDWEKECEL